MRWLGVLMLLATAGCAHRPAATPGDLFFTSLSQLCGQAFAGRVVSDDPADAAMAGQSLVMHVRDCSADEIRIPFHVGADRSRTWVVRRDGGRLSLHHDHRHEDGSPDVTTGYGGIATTAGTAEVQAFPADVGSIALFRREGREAAVANVWTLERTPTRFAYMLTRPGRRFRAELDLTRPVAAPPPAWGAE